LSSTANLGKEFNLTYKGRKYVFIANSTSEANEWITACNETRDKLKQQREPKRETEVLLLLL
jgi:hypothetical protein